MVIPHIAQVGHRLVGCDKASDQRLAERINLLHLNAQPCR